MQLTRAADYAVRVMIYLASQPEGAVVSKTILAKASDAPESFLSKILQAMTRAGLIQARRGVVGGFTLLARGAQASMLDVVESMDGPVALNLCLNSETACPRTGECAAHQVWMRAQAAMLAVLREAKIAEMAGGAQSCGNLPCVARATGGLSSSKGNAGPRTVPSGALRGKGKKENIKK